MSRILLVGVGPLAIDPQAASGPHFRTTLFWQCLHGAGHELFLASLGDEHANGLSEEPLPGGGVMRQFSPAMMLDVKPVRDWAVQLHVNALIGVGTIMPASTAAQLNDVAPVWIDLAGDPIAEVQSKAEAYPEQNCDALLAHVTRLTEICLRGGDCFSGVSHAQSHAMVGQLALLGRLNARTAGQVMVHKLPNGACPRLPAPAAGAPLFRGVDCPRDAFLVAWSGSYNTWMDEDLLYRGLIAAMQRDERIHFVSTGGGAEGYNEGIYGRFRQHVESGLYRERFHLLGWIARDRAEAIHAECDIGLNIDRWCYEGILGARNRIVSLLSLGLPVATTVLAEVSRELVQAGGAFEIPLGHSAAMADLLVKLSAQPQQLSESLQRGRKWLARNDFQAFARPLLDWAEKPVHAGDYAPASATAPALPTSFSQRLMRKMRCIKECLGRA